MTQAYFDSSDVSLQKTYTILRMYECVCQHESGCQKVMLVSASVNMNVELGVSVGTGTGLRKSVKTPPHRELSSIQFRITSATPHFLTTWHMHSPLHSTLHSPLHSVLHSPLHSPLHVTHQSR